ncbi:MAG: hypothetical protein KIH63_004700 [Candidatus Saccharibacteria bacterium]|nr:hypothetical protein [Candidatus Saccharibacteria bacterium]
MSSNLCRALRHKFPELVFSVTGEDYNSLIIHNDLPKPTIEEVEVALRELAVEDEKIKYIQKRNAEYPSINQMVVCLWEMVVENRPEDAKALQKIREVIKKKYPMVDEYDTSAIADASVDLI